MITRRFDSSTRMKLAFSVSECSIVLRFGFIDNSSQSSGSDPTALTIL